MFSDVHIGRERLDADCRLAQRFLRHERLIYFPLLFFLCVMSVLLCIVGAATQKQQNKKNREIESKKKNNTTLPPPQKIGGGGVRGGGGMHSHNIYRDDYWSGREKWRPTMAAL